jgi:hypothetical protein
MRPWMIVLSSAIGAIVVGAALAVPEVLDAPRPEIGPMVLLHLPALAVAALAMYALCAMLLTTATLVAGTLRVRHHLARTASDRAPPQRDWVADFGANGFQQLAPRLAPALAQSTRADGRVVLQARFNPTETRSEIARLYYISLARSHFFSALIVLAGVVGLGLAQDHNSLPFLSGTIPTTSVILILVGLVLLAVLGRIAIDVTAEPLLETIAQLPAERVEVGLLRRAVELLEVACNAPASDTDRAPSAPPQLPERLVAVIEQGHHALLDAVGRLTANTQALGATLRSSVETLETTVRTSAAQQQPMDESAVANAAALLDAVGRLTANTQALGATLRSSVETLETTVRTSAAQQQPMDESTVANAVALPELQAAVEELTAVLQRLSASPSDTDEPPLAADPVSRRRMPAPRLARELQNLLREIEAAR